MQGYWEIFPESPGYVNIWGSVNNDILIPGVNRSGGTDKFLFVRGDYSFTWISPTNKPPLVSGGRKPYLLPGMEWVNLIILFYVANAMLSITLL